MKRQKKAVSSMDIREMIAAAMFLAGLVLMFVTVGIVETQPVFEPSALLWAVGGAVVIAGSVAVSGELDR